MCIRSISPLKAYTAIAPLLFVLITSMIREGVEDMVRYKQDKISNSQSVEVSFPPGLHQNKGKEPELAGDIKFRKE